MKKQSKALQNRNHWKELSTRLRLQKPNCEYCLKEPSAHVHHIVSKYFKKSMLRFDERNLVCLCAKCHFTFHKNPVSTMEWMILRRTADYHYILKKLGE